MIFRKNRRVQTRRVKMMEVKSPVKMKENERSIRKVRKRKRSTRKRRKNTNVVMITVRKETRSLPRRSRRKRVIHSGVKRNHLS